MHLSKYVKQHLVGVKRLVFVLCLVPVAILFWEYQTDQLGVNKLERITRVTGIWALNFQLLALTITPVRRILASWMKIMRASYGKRLSDWNWLVKLRRMIGLYAFFYTCLHLLIFIWLDQDFGWYWILQEMLEKPYLFVGTLAFILLIPVALSSTDKAMRKLGKNWRRIHRTVYLIGALSVLHYIWLSKLGKYQAIIYLVILVILLGYRVLEHYGRLIKHASDDGMEVAERK
jgi:sulfoxide reductase heme-binding subunit YedZ